MNNLVDKYIEAWIKHDIKILSSIFHKDILYDDRGINSYAGIEELLDYWIENSKKQRDVTFKSIEIINCKNKIILHWEASFFHLVKKKKKFLKGIIIMTVLDNKIIHFVEYFERKYI